VASGQIVLRRLDGHDQLGNHEIEEEQAA